MSGILNAKERIMDTFLTVEGRKQLAQGTLRAEYISFTDSGMFYKLDTIVSGGLNITNRFQLEAGSLVHDTITVETDDTGKLIGFAISGSQRFSIGSGQILSSSISENETVPVTGSQFSSLSETILSNSIDNFKNLYILRSPDPIDVREKHFTIGSKSKNFIITADKPFGANSLKTVNVDHVESFFQDKRLSHVPNYLFLPPVNKSKLGVSQKIALGDYLDINQQPILTFEDVKAEVFEYEAQGFSETFTFTETSKESNIFGQFFEVSAGQMAKLEVIDFGTFTDGNQGTKHVFFVGKVFEDSMGSFTFVNMFTLIFS